MPQSMKPLPSTRSEQDDDFAESVLAGLSKPDKSLPCRFFYDQRGSALFDEITRLPEYYPTRTEAAILASCATEIAGGMSERAILVEFGSGLSHKTEILLAHLPSLYAYVPIDVSASALNEAKHRLFKQFPGLDVRPVIADFSRPLTLPEDFTSRPKLGFFPGSTIGNFAPLAARRLLRLTRQLLAPDGRLIIGVDLKKDTGQLIAAYNDCAGVTAAFNLNLLERINRELGGTFDLTSFRHQAIYNSRAGRIEMHLVSSKDQAVRVLGRPFHLRAGETIHTENCYKYSIGQFQAFARTAGWLPGRFWCDAGKLFSVHELIAV